MKIEVYKGCVIKNIAEILYIAWCFYHHTVILSFSCEGGADNKTEVAVKHREKSLKTANENTSHEDDHPKGLSQQSFISGVLSGLGIPRRGD